MYETKINSLALTAYQVEQRDQVRHWCWHVLKRERDHRERAHSPFDAAR